MPHSTSPTRRTVSGLALSAMGLGLLFICGFNACKAERNVPPDLRLIPDLDYSGKNNPRQKLDLYLPKTASTKPLPLVVYIHGGGWLEGQKEDASPLYPLLKSGNFAGAAIAYRLTKEAVWPAQIHDCKAALRWIAAHASEYGIDSQRVALYGISAGGHLVSLLGTSVGVSELDGDVGTKGPSVGIRCILNFCGPVNFLTIPGKGSIIDTEDLKSPVGRLFGGPMSHHLDTARIASPVTYATPDDPPFLHIHGTKDDLVPVDQAREFDATLEKVGVKSTLLLGEGAPHVFFSADLIRKMQTFLTRHLADGSEDVPEGPVATK